MLRRTESSSTLEVDNSGAESSNNTTDKRELFMQTMSQYLNGVETKFGWCLFDAIVNDSGEDPLTDSYFVFRK